ncbi:ROK family transcriptional regulator [Mahella australiensis]|uniref:ROK family protein n=1 Tax=Mahella australiensis (strain DSM 15567 / CIP 107919 / 50-1 BON) TaxID=697281 RepID=F4A254_MAHA5|nr:ROK family transcriptional regulator [Mahella australiensis]AEE97193.1 ROK family protein [Mahella australiensis 50-1 BON]
MVFPNDAKKVSNKNIFELIRRYGPISKADLSNMIGCSITTVSRAVEELLTSDIILVNDTGDSKGGRKPMLYSINGNACYSFAIEISRGLLMVTLINLNAEIIAKKVFYISSGITPEEVVTKIAETIGEISGHLNNELINKILGVCITTTGPLDRKNGIILKSHSFDSDRWNNVPICEMLKRKISFPVFLDNLACASILAEHWYGAAKNLDNAVFVYTSYGIGCGIITNGYLLEGVDDITGALGHMIIDINGEKCTCGHKGCLETFSSIPYMLKHASEAILNGRQTILTQHIGQDISCLTFDMLCEALVEGDELCNDVINKAAYAYGLALANFINLMRPKMVILGGETIDKCPCFYDIAVATAIESTYPEPVKDIKFDKASLGMYESVIGAAAKVFNLYLNERKHENIL